jgi:hypothetical protein
MGKVSKTLQVSKALQVSQVSRVSQVSKVKLKSSSRMKRWIISIDVGVKNLAICILGEREDTGVEILLWKWYNVLAPKEETPCKKRLLDKTKAKTKSVNYGICQTIIKRTKKPCGLKGILNNRGRAYCGRHDPTKKHTPLDTQQWCYDMLQNLPVITKDILSALKPTTNGQDVDKPIQVIIEQQAIDNKKILLQSHLIFGHFVSMFDNQVPVRFIPAYNKLLVYDGPEVTTILKTPYARRKFLSKRYTEYYLEKLPSLGKWKPFFESCRTKQDDIADAFLQGLYVIKGAAKEHYQIASGKRRKRKVRF